MRLGKLVTLLLGLVVLAFAVRTALRSRGAQESAEAASAPKRQLDNVREKARDIERDAQQRADDLAKKLPQ